MSDLRSNADAEQAPTARQPVDFSHSAISRYIQLATLFRRRIESGQWQVGNQIPTVEELAAECGVARATIRQALDLLEKERLIERFRAKGTFVRRRPQTELWCSVPTDWSGLLRPNSDARIEIIHDESDIKVEGMRYPLGELAPSYRRLHRRHWRDGMPFLLTEVHIDERLRDRISREDIETKTALRLINDVPGIRIVEAQQTLTIGAADMETAQALSLPINAPVAFVDRVAVDADGTAVLIAHGIYRGDVVRFDLKLR
jgi:GntR family transcriptional regulator